MSASTAPAVKAALVTLLAADPTIVADEVQVEYAEPGSGLRQEAIWFDRTVLREEAAAFGYQRRNEDYTLELVVFVAQDGDEAQLCEERAWELVAIVENTLRGNPTAGGAVNLSVQFIGAEMQPGFAPKGAQRVAIATCELQCKSRK